MKKNVINILFIFVVLFTTGAVLHIYKNLLDDKKMNTEAYIGVMEQQEEEVSFNLDEYRKELNNEELMGRITIPGTTINTLFAQTNDNKYYLRHNLKKDYNRLGSIFLDARNELSDKQLNLYAHNSLIYDNATFKDLSLFLDKEFAEGNDIIQIETEKFSRKYQIVSVKQTSDQEHMALKSKNFDNHIRIIRSNNIYDNKDISINENQNILVLQTCVMNDKKEIIVILAVEV